MNTETIFIKTKTHSGQVLLTKKLVCRTPIFLLSRSKSNTCYCVKTSLNHVRIKSVSTLFGLMIRQQFGTVYSGGYYSQ